jgi:hypothetical protein
MKRYWAVLLSAATLCGCRNAQPTNPFLRTTVPPPATSGVVVTPGTPYAQGISPPMVTTPAPAITPAPVTTQPVPVTPAPVAPAAPMTTPPPVSAQGDQFKYPGGSYLFHQSSNEPTPRVLETDDAGPVTVVVAKPPIDDGVVQATYVEPGPVKIRSSMQPAEIIENPYVKKKATPPNTPAGSSTPKPETQPGPKPAAQPMSKNPAAQTARKSAAQTKPAVQSAPSQPAVTRMSLGDKPASPQEPPRPLSVGSAATGNLLRIVGQPMSSSLPPAKVAGIPPAVTFSKSGSHSTSDVVLRITAGGPPASIAATVPGAAPAQSTLVVSSSGSSSTTTLVDNGGNAQPVVQAAFQPAADAKGRSDYAHSTDYSSLRGRLEYSPIQRQWKLRYIPIDGKTDGFGGSVVLPDSELLKGFQPGDFVAVQGTLGETSATSGYAPRYLPTSIQRIRR